MLVVATLFESLRPLGLWVSVLAGGPYNIKGTCLLNVKSSEKAFLNQRGRKVNVRKKRKAIQKESMRRHGIEIQSEKDLRTFLRCKQ